jgi:hypothetical protein
MKWIKKRDYFLKEAKIGDVINPKQKEVVSKRWGKKYLEYEEIEPNDDIKAIQGNWKLEPEQKYKVLFSENFAHQASPTTQFLNIPERLTPDSWSMSLKKKTGMSETPIRTTGKS